MSVYSARTVEDLMQAELVGLYPTLDGGLRLPPDDFSPNPNWRDAARSGEPEGWFIPMPPRRRGYFPYVSAPGKRTAGAGVPNQETLPPLERTMTRQTAAPLSYGAAWVAQGEIIGGTTPLKEGREAPLPKPPAPEVLAVPRTFAGFAAGIFGWAWGLEDEDGNRTPPSAYSFTEGPIAEGQGLRLPIPDVTGTTARYIYIALTTPDGGPETGKVQRRVDLRQGLPPSIDLTGPYKDEGTAPPDKNETGVGRLPAPSIGKPHPHRAFVQEVPGPEGLGIPEGIWRFYLQVERGGLSLLGLPSDEITVVGDDETVRRRLDEGEEPAAGETLETIGGIRYGSKVVHNKVKMGRVFRFRPPRNLERDQRYVPVVRLTPLAGGQSTLYRLGHRHRPDGASVAFADTDDEEPGVPIHGYTAESAPKGLRYILFEFTEPSEDDPEADGTAITPPDPAGKPDVPMGIGISWPAVPATYKAAISEAVDGTPGEGPISESVSRRILGGAEPETLKVRTTPRVGLIPNAEGSDRNPKGLPSEWTFDKIGPGFAPSRKVEDGTLVADSATVVTSGNFWTIDWPTVKLPAGVDTNACMVGTLSVTSHTSGGVQFLLQELDEAGSVVKNNVLATLSTAGTKTLLPLGRFFGGDGIAWTADTVSVRPRLRPDPAFAEWRQRVIVKDVQLFPFRAALRKFRALAPDAEDTEATDADGVSPATPYPNRSRFALGPAPRPPGAPVSAPTALMVADFAGGVWPSGNTAVNTPAGNNAVIEADATTPMGTGYRWRVSDTTTSESAKKYREKTYVTADITGENFATRVLFRVPPAGSGMPTRGELNVLQIRDQTGTLMAEARLTFTGTIKVARYNPSGSFLEAVNVLGGISAGSLVDVELAVTKGDTKNAAIRCSVGVNRPRSTSQTFSGLDYVNRRPRTRRVGAMETDSAARWALWVYSVVDTLGGDILNREDPLPIDANSPPPDAPTIGTTPRLRDSENEKINQLWLFLEKGLGFGNGYGPETARPIVVKPEHTYTQAVFARWRLLEINDPPSHQFFITLTGIGMDPLRVGSPFGSGPGATQTARTGQMGGMAESSAGGWAEYVQTFTIPPGYTYASIGPRNECPGVYVFQEHLFGQGILDTLAARDAKRAYGALNSGTFRVTLDTKLNQGEFTPPPLSHQRWVRFGASHGHSGLAGVTWTARSTSTRPYGAWSPETQSPPEAEVIQISGTLSASGASRPEIPSGAIHLDTRRHHPVLLDEYRRDFPGMVVIGDEPLYYSYADENEEPVSAHAFATTISDEVERLGPMTLLALTHEAARALKEITANTILNVESPLADGTGRVFKIRFYSRLDVEVGSFVVPLYGGTQRCVATVETPEAEVLSVSRLGKVWGS